MNVKGKKNLNITRTCGLQRSTLDLIYFYHFIDKLAQGECSRIRFRISDGLRHFAFATISAKSASETARRINGKQILGVSKLDKRKLKSHLAV